MDLSSVGGVLLLVMAALAVIWASAALVAGMTMAVKAAWWEWRQQVQTGVHAWRVVALVHHGQSFHLTLQPCAWRLRALIGWSTIQGGQYLTLSAAPTGALIRRRYSLVRLPRWSWNPAGWVLELAIKREEGGLMSHWLADNLSPGAVIEAQGPVGSFCWPRSLHGEQLLIGGGIGFTPLRAMIDEWHRRGQPVPLTFVWVVRDPVEWMGFLSPLQALTAQCPSFRFVPVLTGKDLAWQGLRGRPRATDLLRWSQTGHPLGVWMCASVSVMDSLRSQLMAAGISASNIHFEAFGAPSNQDAECHEVSDTTGRRLAFQGQPSLLAAMLSHGWAIDHDCRNGSCGACSVRLVSGQVREVLRAECAVPPGHCLACAVVPASNVMLGTTSH